MSGTDWTKLWRNRWSTTHHHDSATELRDLNLDNAGSPSFPIPSSTTDEAMASPLEKVRGSSPLEVEDPSVDETRALLGSRSPPRSSYDSSSSDDTQPLKPVKIPFFIENLFYTPEEESAVLRIIDTHLMPCILLTTFVLNMDRTNNSNAISDNLPADLGFDINVVNTATAMYSVLFATACLTGAVIAKIVGPHRCVSMVAFSKLLWFL